MYPKFRKFIHFILVGLLLLVPGLGLLLMISGDARYNALTIFITLGLLSVTTLLFGIMVFMLGMEWERTTSQSRRDFELTLVTVSDRPFVEYYSDGEE